MKKLYYVLALFTGLICSFYSFSQERNYRSNRELFSRYHISQKLEYTNDSAGNRELNYIEYFNDSGDRVMAFSFDNKDTSSYTYCTYDSQDRLIKEEFTLKDEGKIVAEHKYAYTYSGLNKEADTYFEDGKPECTYTYKITKHKRVAKKYDLDGKLAARHIFKETKNKAKSVSYYNGKKTIVEIWDWVNHTRYYRGNYENQNQIIHDKRYVDSLNRPVRLESVRVIKYHKKSSFINKKRPNNTHRTLTTFTYDNQRGLIQTECWQEIDMETNTPGELHCRYFEFR